jgi:WD40 repeat protein
VLGGNTRDVVTVAWSPNGRRVAVGSDDHTARLWTPSTRSFVRFDLPAAVTDVAFSANGAQIVIAAADGTVRVYATDTGTQLYALEGHTSSVSSARFSRDGARVLTAAGDGTARIWDVAPPRPVAAPSLRVPEFASLLGHDTFTKPAPLDPRWALRTLHGEQIIDARSRRTVAALPALRNGDYDGTVFDRTGRVMLVMRTQGLGDLPVQVRQADGGRVLRTLAGPGSRAAIGAISRDGSLAAAADARGRVGIWDVASGRQLTAFRGHATGLKVSSGQKVAGLAFSPDGRLVLSGDTLGRDFVWEARTGRVLNRIRGPALPPRYEPAILGTFSPDGRLVAVAWPWDEAVHLYSLGVHAEQATLRAPTGGVFDVAFNDDGSLLATAGQGIRVWDVRARQLLTTIATHDDVGVNRVQFTPDGAALATDGAAGITNITPKQVFPCVVCGSTDRLLALARTRVTRRLTAAERTAYLHR